MSRLDATAPTRMTAYRLHVNVLSQHVDPTGIVPVVRYLEMAQGVIENWFDEALDWSFSQMQGRDRLGLPMARCEMAFPAASRLGDALVWQLEVTRIGRTSLDLRVIASCGGETRVRLTSTVVLADLGVILARRWPESIRERLGDYLHPPEPA